MLSSLKQWAVVDTINGIPYYVHWYYFFKSRASRAAKFYNSLTRTRQDAYYELKVYHRDQVRGVRGKS